MGLEVRENLKAQSAISGVKREEEKMVKDHHIISSTVQNQFGLVMMKMIAPSITGLKNAHSGHAMTMKTVRSIIGLKVTGLLATGLMESHIGHVMVNRIILLQLDQMPMKSQVALQYPHS